MKTLSKGITVLLVGVLVGLIGCSASTRPFEYETNRELKPGPGLLSGEDGYFTIYKQQAPAEAKAPKGSETQEESISEEDTE